MKYRQTVREQVPRICVIFNVFIHEQYKLLRLLEALKRLDRVSGIAFSILIRGPLKDASRKEIQIQVIEKSRNIFHLETSESSRDWKINTLKMVLEQNYKYFILAQEDHLLLAEPSSLRDFLNECIERNVNVASLSFFESTRKLSSFLEVQDNTLVTSLGTYARLDKNWDRNMDFRVWLINLLCFIDRTTLIKILESPRPILKKFPPFTPFDFEQGSKTSWYLPIVVSQPRIEMFACIDDGPTGTSLQERGAYPLDKVRVPIHNVASTTSGAPSFVHHLTTYIERLIKSPRVQSHKFLSRCLVSFKFRLNYLVRLKYSLVWWFYVITRGYFSLTRFRIKINKY